MSRRSWLKGAAACLLLACVGWAAAGCGVKARPKPPEVPIIPGL